MDRKGSPASWKEGKKKKPEKKRKGKKKHDQKNTVNGES